MRKSILKKKDLDLSSKSMIIRWSKERKKQKEIAKLLNISQQSVSYFLKFYKSGILFNKKLYSDRKSLISKEVEQVIKEKVESNRLISSFKLLEDLRKHYPIRVSSITLGRSIKNPGIKAMSPRKFLLYSDKNKRARLDLTKKFFNKPKDFWKRVIWSDETEINFFCSEGKKYVWRRE